MSALKATAAICAFALLETAFSVVFYYGLTRDAYRGANDFYVPWRAAQARLLEGRDPYSAEVTRDIQIGLFGRARRPDEHQFNFAYPLYATFLLAPLIALPYDAAQAVWYALLLPLVIASGVLLLRNLGIRLNPLQFGAFVLWLLCFYPTTRSFILGQLAIVVFACVVGAWWAARRRYDDLVGGLLALTTIKPQMVFLLLPLALAYALHTRRWGFLRGFAVTLGILLGVSLAIQPSWLVSFLQTAQAYSRYFDSLSPLQILFANDALALAVSLGLVALLVGGAVQSARNGWERKESLGMWAIIIAQLVAVHTATTNQIILIISLLFGLKHGALWFRSPLKVVVVLLVALVAPWAVFLATIQANNEQPPAFLPLSVGVCLWWLAEEIAGYWQRQSQSTPRTAVSQR